MCFDTFLSFVKGLFRRVLMIKLLWISFLPSLSEDVIPSPLEDTVLGSFSHYVCLFCVFLSFKGDIDSKNRRKKKKNVVLCSII